LRLGALGPQAVNEIVKTVRSRGDAAVSGELIAPQRIGEPAMPGVRKALTDESAAVRRLAVAALEHIGGDGRLEILVTAANDDETRDVALIALGRLVSREGKTLRKLVAEFGPELKPALHAALKEKDWRKRAPALFFITHMGASLSGLELGILLKPTDESPPEKQVAARAYKRGYVPSVMFNRSVRRNRYRVKIGGKRIGKALAWLDEQQGKDGAWKAAEPDFEVGIIGLVVLTHLGEGVFDHPPLQRGIEFLIRTQTPRGDFGFRKSHHFVYNHAIATCALAEYRLLSGDCSVDVALRRALKFLLKARAAPNRQGDRGWGYEVGKGIMNSAASTWGCLALWRAWMSGFRPDPGAFGGAVAEFDRLTDTEFGQVGYWKPGGLVSRTKDTYEKFPAEKSQAPTASRVLVRLLFEPRQAETHKKGVVLVNEFLPLWDQEIGSIDMYFWTFGTLLMTRYGGAHARKWNRALSKAVLKHQRDDGSWPAVGAWGATGGDVYATAMLTIALQAPYRVERAR